jgi:hypothetical protein
MEEGVAVEGPPPLRRLGRGGGEGGEADVVDAEEKEGPRDEAATAGSFLRDEAAPPPSSPFPPFSAPPPASSTRWELPVLSSASPTLMSPPCPLRPNPRPSSSSLLSASSSLARFLRWRRDQVEEEWWEAEEGSGSSSRARTEEEGEGEGEAPPPPPPPPVPLASAAATAAVAGGRILPTAAARAPSSEGFLLAAPAAFEEGLSWSRVARKPRMDGTTATPLLLPPPPPPPPPLSPYASQPAPLSSSSSSSTSTLPPLLPPPL